MGRIKEFVNKHPEIASFLALSVANASILSSVALWGYNTINQSPKARNDESVLLQKAQVLNLSKTGKTYQIKSPTYQGE